MNKKQKMKQSVIWNIAIAFLFEATQEGYNRLRNVVLVPFKLADHDLPSYYYVTKY